MCMMVRLVQILLPNNSVSRAPDYIYIDKIQRGPGLNPARSGPSFSLRSHYTANKRSSHFCVCSLPYLQHHTKYSLHYICTCTQVHVNIQV